MKAISLLALLFLSITSLHALPESNVTAIQYNEEYEPSYFQRFQNVNAIISYADSIHGAQNRKTLAYCEEVVAILRKRFYHGYSHYELNNNWIAAVAGKTVWNHLSAIVIPDEILKYPNAACSQQAIVFMECFKKIGVDYRSVQFTGHYALEAKIGTEWYYFDSNMEPDFHGNRASIEKLVKSKEIFELYQHKRSKEAIEGMLAGLHYGKVNEAPAPQAYFFHIVTYVFSTLGIGVLGYLAWTTVTKGFKKVPF